MKLYEGDFRTWVEKVEPFKMLFADPPDNIGWKYDGYLDKIPPAEYEQLIWTTLNVGVDRSEIFWMSYNCNHMDMVGHLIHMSPWRNQVEIRHLVQYVTFGINLKSDFSRCFRPIVRIMRKDATTYPDAVRIESERQRMGDKRADPRGKIPPDVWAIHRVTGNSKQRRSWHNTQLNEALYERCLDFSCVQGDRVGDLYAGTGTLARASKGRNLEVSLFELSSTYCEKLSEEHGVEIQRLEDQ